MTTITRTINGFIITDNFTLIARFTTLDGEPAVAYHEPNDPYECYVTTKHPRGIAYVAYYILRREARWRPELEWDI